MSKDFDKCVKNGGDVKTVQKGKGKYQRTCSFNGKIYKSPIKKKKNV